MKDGTRAGNLLRDLGDWFYAKGWDAPTEFLYWSARKLGGNMEWKPK